jgi:lipoate-protein ligase B
VVHGYWVDLGLIGYQEAFALQDLAVARRIKNNAPPAVILQENPPTFTIGRSGTPDNILAPPDVLQKKQIEVIRVNRGGDITYHGPGQVIVSPLLRLEDIGLNANQYMHRLEDILIEVLREYGVTGEKKSEYPGVWWQNKKIAAVGIAVRRGFTFHGFSLNLNLDCEPFGLINPCGVPRMPVVSLHEILQTPVDPEAVKADLKDALERTFDHGFDAVTHHDFETLMSLPDDDQQHRKENTQ